MTMLTKLTYVGINTEDLVHIYIIYIRGLLEYCSVAWHSTLTVEQTLKIENVQKLCLKVIFGAEYSSYEDALKWSGLKRLNERRQQKCLKFGLKSLLHPVHSKLFPVNTNSDTYCDTRKKEHFRVNWTNSESYRMSAVPYIQRMLNDLVVEQQNKKKK